MRAGLSHVWRDASRTTGAATMRRQPSPVPAPPGAAPRCSDQCGQRAHTYHPRVANKHSHAGSQRSSHRSSTLSVRFRRHPVIGDRPDIDAIARLSAMSAMKTSDLIGLSPGGRKLIAVVYADMVGYSRLIALDDVGTIDPAIDAHGGQIVQTGGDSLLITFDSNEALSPPIQAGARAAACASQSPPAASTVAPGSATPARSRSPAR